jgi:hypothetical protein
MHGDIFLLLFDNDTVRCHHSPTLLLWDEMMSYCLGGALSLSLLIHVCLFVGEVEMRCVPSNYCFSAPFPSATRISELPLINAVIYTVLYPHDGTTKHVLT